MPVHDWTRVDAGTFHDFHTAWITHLKEALNAGLLPPDFYALSEQRAGETIPDVLALHAQRRDVPRPDDSAPAGAVAVAEAPPHVSVTLTADEPI